MRSFTLAGPRVRRLAVATALSATLAAGSLTEIGIASAATSHPASTTAVIVKERTRAHFGKILVTVHGAALYFLPSGSCTGACLSIWPRLVMPKGTTKPRGANCLGTKAFGTHHRLQVTYRGHRLYRFIDDTGTSVTGNNVEGFKVAKVARTC